jgi:methionyl-tRNA formyltransferase
LLKIIFMGTPDFALPAVEAIKNSGNELIAVVTQPDKPKGRGKHMTPPPVKEWAVYNNYPVFQPQKLKGNQEFLNQLKKLNPDLIVTAAYGQILPKDILDIPPLGCINVHASLLPDYRGASPIQQVLIDGKEKTGISIMYMDVGMDTGDIILQSELDIYPDENAGQLHDRLSELGGESLAEVIKMFENGKPAGKPQDSEKATYCGKIDKSMGEIRWEQSADTIFNLVRGLTPWPGAFTFLHGKRLKIFKALPTEYSTGINLSPGSVLEADQTTGLLIACGQGVIRIAELQEEGGRPMSDLEYLRGNPIEIGTELGKAKNMKRNFTNEKAK